MPLGVHSPSLSPNRPAARCIAYGYAVRTTLPLPGAIARTGDGAAIDIEVIEAPVSGGGAIDGPYQRVPGGVIFTARNVARYLCTATSISIERNAGVSDERVAGLLIATALPACLWMRGEIVLHAAAVVLPGATRAVAILGASGSGKSTLLHALVARGARVLADDSLCVSPGAAGRGLAGGYFLGSEPRIFHAVRPEQSLLSAPLAAAIILDLPRSSGVAVISRLEPLAAFQALLDHRHRPRIPAVLGLEAGLLPRLASLAQMLPVHRWQRREGRAALGAEELTLLARL